MQRRRINADRSIMNGADQYMLCPNVDLLGPQKELSGCKREKVNSLPLSLFSPLTLGLFRLSLSLSEHCLYVSRPPPAPCRFINARRRIVQPMIDQSNRSGQALSDTEHKTKPFWLSLCEGKRVLSQVRGGPTVQREQLSGATGSTGRPTSAFEQQVQQPESGRSPLS